MKFTTSPHHRASVHVIAISRRISLPEIKLECLEARSGLASIKDSYNHRIMASISVGDIIAIVKIVKDLVSTYAGALSHYAELSDT
jgi:hypothetical protein